MSDPLEALIADWRAYAMAAGQASVEGGPEGADATYASAEAASFTRCANELAALLPMRSGSWQPIETAPKDGRFLVACDLRIMVMDGYLLALSRLRDTPPHLSGHHWTHWMPLPPAPRPSPAGNEPR